jgi:carboxypeptidase C (cathepsin A)
MLAFMQEHGPYLMDVGATTFRNNKYSWNREANMLYIEQPAGVGFSTCTSDNKADCAYDDNVSAKDNMLAVLAFYDLFPEYK